MNFAAVTLGAILTAVQVASAAVDTLHHVDSALCSQSWYRQPRDAILDNVLGPAESLEYTGTTTPVVAP